MKLSEIFSAVTAVAAVISAIAALIAVKFAYRRFPEEGRRQRELTARPPIVSIT
jgi:hypothetical protein